MKLVKSLKDFPEMLEARPVVVDENMVILGGNQRYRACFDAGLKEIPVVVRKWDESKDKEFVIKDNVSYGQWDWDVMANEFDNSDLGEWMTDFNFDYEPTLDPTFSHEDVTAEHIAKKQGQLESKFEDGKQVLNVTCPECGNEFFVDK